MNPSNQSYGFSSSHVWIWELDRKEGWALKNWCFQTVVLEKTLESPFDSKVFLKEINPYSLEELMLKLKLQYFGHLMERTNSLEKAQILGKIEGRRQRGQQRTKWLDGITNSTDRNLSKFQKTAKDREASHAAVHGITKSQTQLSDWTTSITLNLVRGIDIQLRTKIMQGVNVMQKEETEKGFANQFSTSEQQSL